MTVAAVPDLLRLGAAELAAAIREGRTSSREVVSAALARIEAVNPAVNAVRVTLADTAMAAAEDADRRLAAGEQVGPLHGVPFTVKENVDVAGSATTHGIAALAEAVAATDAPSVAHLRAAGAIPIARTNMPDFALRWHTDSGIAGATVNPWDSARTPGGSSGGEAVALVTGMTPLGVGNDLGGSLRWPAQCCGIASLRPTLGRVAHATSVPPVDAPLSIQLLNVNGPMARRVEDLRLALEIMSRPSPRDPWHAPVPVEGPALAAPIGVSVALWPDVDPEVAAGVRRAAEALRAAGYAVEEGEPPMVDEAVQTWASVLIGELRAVWPMMEPAASPDARRFVESVFEAVPAIDIGGHVAGMIGRQAIARAWAEHQEQRPLILAPISAAPPFAVGEDLGGPDVAGAMLGRMRMVVPVNVLGLPSAAVPVGDANGMPQAVQVIGPRFREDLCLDAAAAIEAAVGPAEPIEPR
jgi:amidase